MSSDINLSDDDDLNNSDIVGIGSTTSGKSRKGIGGAKRISKTYEYFIENQKTGKGVCQVKLDNGKICGEQISLNCSTLENHIKLKHPTFYSSSGIQEAKKQRRDARMASSSANASAGTQLTISGSFIHQQRTSTEMYSDGHAKQSSFNRSLILLLAGTSVPYQIVSDPLFIDVIRMADPKLKLPTCQAASKSISELDGLVKERVKSILKKTNRLVSLSADIWSRRGLTASFLGVTAHFFDEAKKAPQCLLLAMPKFSTRHTADNILLLLESILGQYEISVDHPKIFRIITDNGSNIKKALEDIEQLIEVQNEISNIGQDQSIIDPAIYDLNIEAEDQEVNEEVAEFEDEENEHFRTFGFQKRLSCIDHGLTCAVRKVVDKNRTVISIKTVAFSLIRSINMSGNAAEFLMRNYGKKLILLPSHRWIYMYYALDRLLVLKDGICELAKENEKVEEHLLNGPQWRQVASLTSLLKPIANFVKDLEGENYVTISRVLPGLWDIEAFLDEAGRSISLVALARDMKNEIRRRFSYIMNPDDMYFQPLYAVAALLDPKFTKLLDLQKYTNLKNDAVIHLKQLVFSSVDSIPAEGPAQSSNQPSPSTRMDSGDELYFRLFSRLEQSENQAMAHRAQSSDVEIDQFLQFRSQISPREAQSMNSPLGFWLSKAACYPILHKVAIDILCAPVTSAAAERVFSQAGLCASSLRNRLSDENVEAEVMIRVNKALL